MKQLAQPHGSKRGFSIVELLIVVAIIVVIAALALPGIQSTLATMTVRNAMGEMSGIAQSCRSLAVRRSKTKALHVVTMQQRVVMFTQTCESAGCTADFDARVNGEDQALYLPTGFELASSGDVPEELDPATIWGNSSTVGTKDVTFNARGLPCDLSTLPCGAPRGFIVYFKYAAPADRTRYIALTVSPAGRIKNFSWNDSNQWGD